MENIPKNENKPVNEEDLFAAQSQNPNSASLFPKSQSMPLKLQDTEIPAKIEFFKNWSLSTFKRSKQLIAEKLGKASRTVDTDLELQIANLRDVQKKYMQILRLTKILSTQFQQLIQTQHSMGELFNELAQKSPELRTEFMCNATTQSSVSRHGAALLSALSFFESSVDTLVNKTIEDTLITIKRFEAARIEYDAYRTEFELLQANPNSEIAASARQNHDKHKAEYEKLRSDVSVKLRFLDENRVKVMQKQLVLFHNAVSAYFSGNQAALESTMKQFSIKIQTGNAAPTSWLEN